MRKKTKNNHGGLRMLTSGKDNRLTALVDTIAELRKENKRLRFKLDVLTTRFHMQDKVKTMDYIALDYGSRSGMTRFSSKDGLDALKPLFSPGRVYKVFHHDGVYGPAISFIGVKERVDDDMRVDYCFMVSQHADGFITMSLAGDKGRYVHSLASERFCVTSSGRALFLIYEEDQYLDERISSAEFRKLELSLDSVGFDSLLVSTPREDGYLICEVK